jgi:antitoxin (DNA-binding transcriptional repressor) of toxin-antitoxin stability system
MVMKQERQPKPEFRIIAAGKFKATCLELMDEVLENRTLTVIITKRGKPVAQLTAPPAGIKLSEPVVELIPTTHAADVSSLQSSAATERPRKKKRKDKKKHK